MQLLEVTLVSGDALDVRTFRVSQGMNRLFEVTLVALSENADIDFESVLGQPASFTARSGPGGAGLRRWAGVCSHLQQTAAEEWGASTYEITIVPALWFLTQRRNHRMFQRMSEIEIVTKMLGEWGIACELRIGARHKKRRYRVQYGESDYAFVCRMLEDAGVSFYFEGHDHGTMVLDDGPHANQAREPPIPFRDNPMASPAEHATRMRIGRRVRPGKVTMRDLDYRRPSRQSLVATAQGGAAVEGRLERFHYAPGAFLFEAGGGDTPAADDKGAYRADPKEGELVAARRLSAKRADAWRLSFETNIMSLSPGMVVSFLDHPKSELGLGKRFLLLETSLEGAADREWSHRVDAVSAELPYHPPMTAPKPRTAGVESATVVGPPGDEIHVDEFGRVRVHFHWDRESERDDGSSCWIPVSQPWSGTGYGGTHLPRVGQEVLVDFLGGDPDRPVIIGRVYTNLQRTPYKLPENKTQSGWKSSSTPATGGYNELLFEDAAGRELVRVQAERDLAMLVKHDESVTIGHDRSQQIGENETMLVGENQTETIGADRSVTIGGKDTEQIGSDVDISIGGSKSEKVAGAVSELVGLARSVAVGRASVETVGGSKSISVEGAFTITVGGGMTTTVSGSHAETVSTVRAMNAGSKVSIACGAATVTLDKSGLVSIHATDMKIQASGEVQIDADSGVKITTGATVKVKAGAVRLN